MATKNDYEGTERRAKRDRRTGEDRRKGRRGIRGLFPFSLFFDRRRGQDRRSGGDRRLQGASDPPLKPTKLGMEPLRLKELSEKSGIPLKRLQDAAVGKAVLSAEEHAALKKP